MSWPTQVLVIACESENRTKLEKILAECGCQVFCYATLLEALSFLSGQSVEASEVLAGIYATREQRYVPPAYLAVAEIGVGNLERAFIALEEAYAAKDATLLYLRILPVFRPLRSDLRYEALCRRVGLPEPAA